MPKKGIENLSPGYATYRWLYSIGAKQPAWFLGSIAGRSAFGAWIAHLAKGFANMDFMTKFQQIVDPWDRSRLVGMKISELRKSFAQLSKAEKEELGRQAEAEFKAGVEMLGRDKALIMQLVQITDPPPSQ